MVPQVSTILSSVPMVLMIMVIEALITPHRISRHLVWPFEERLAFNLLQNLLYWFSEYSIHHLGVGRSWLSNKIFLRSVIMGPVQLEIPSLLRDHLCLSFSLQLVFLYFYVFIDSIHKLMHASDKFTHQKFPQIIFG